MGYRRISEQMIKDKQRLPLTENTIQALRRELKIEVLIHGRYVLDEDSKMLGLRLSIELPGAPQPPLEAAAPMTGFPQFIEQITLALIEQLGVPISDSLRQKIHDLPRPANFEAFRQTAQATLAWAKGQNQLALASISSALALDPDLDDAAAIEVAVARSAGDTTTTREAFRRWTSIATRQRRPLVAAERQVMLGHWLAERGEWIDARRAYEDARSLFQTGGNEYGQAQVANNIANLDMFSGKMQDAIQTYRRSLRVFETAPSGQTDTAVTYFNLALAHKSLGQQEEAERAIEEALLAARRLKDTRLEALCLAQRGALRDDMGQWGQASADYVQSARLLDVVGDERAIAIVKSHQALLKRQQGVYNQAETLMLEAEETLGQIVDRHEQAVVWFNLADLYLAMGLYDQAWEYAEKADEVFAKMKSTWTERSKALLATIESIPKESPAPEPTIEERLFPFSVSPAEEDSNLQPPLPKPAFLMSSEDEDDIYGEEDYDEEEEE
jgi:tetratricopeptide (TPR) repeat protein